MSQKNKSEKAKAAYDKTTRFYIEHGELSDAERKLEKGEPISDQEREVMIEYGQLLIAELEAE